MGHLTLPRPVVRPRSQMDAEKRRVAENLWMWCPGCEDLHMVTTWRADGGAAWTWDGNQVSPTISPSILVHEIRKTDGSVYSPTCHSFVRAGRWQFLGDCGHALAGQTVDMVPIPDGVL